MKNVIVCLLFFCVIFSLSAGAWTWAKSLDAAEVRAWDMASSPFCDALWVAGQFSETMNFMGQEYPALGEPDAYVAKYSLAGEEQWFRSFGSPEEDVCFSVATGYNDWGNCFFTGYFNGTMSVEGIELVSNGSWDVFYGKLDADGNLQWLKKFGGALYDMGYGMAVDSEDYFVITGWFADSIDFGNGIILESYGGSDMFLARFDPQGNCLWARHGGGIGVDYGFKVDVGLDGKIYATGTSSVGADFDGLTPSQNGMFLAVYDVDGTILRLTSAKNANPINISVSKQSESESRVLLTGRVTGSAIFDGVTYSSMDDSDDIFLAEYDFEENLWSNVQIIGGPGSDKGRAVFVHDVFGYSLAASFEEELYYQGLEAIAEGSWDCLLIREFDEPAMTWFGSQNTDVIADLLRYDAFREYSCGWYCGEMNLGGVTLNSGSDFIQSGFVACYDFSASSVNAEFLPAPSSLFCYPNPFGETLYIQTKLGEAQTLRVFNLKGQKVKTLQPQGKNNWHWDGRNESGSKCPPGVYIISGEKGLGVRKILLAP
ncbi:MAG: T9SS type A sorting domain-containing protein [Candidatus Cloacimonetes bacterium]|nr:T9SS type A sorting domain-containing protein [Candidatus Cloacimonadota bacterium]